MPKIVSEDERKLTKEAIYEKTVHLIREKGTRAVTVDDIANAVGIGKGSFYTYFPSKEACLYEVILRCEEVIFSRIEEIMASIHSDKDKAILVLNEIYTAEDSIVTAVNLTDKEILLRKLPPEYRERENEKSKNHFQKALLLMNLNQQQMEVVAMLTDCLSSVASNKSYSKNGSKEALDILIYTIADYVTGRNI